MRLHLQILLIIILSINLSGYSQRQIWTVGTANTLGKKDLRVAIFQTSAYGLTNSLEISSLVLLFPFAPNLYAKKQWYKNKKLAIASKHGALYPTWILNSKLASSFSEDIYDDATAPGILSFKNEVLVSLNLGQTTCPSYTSKEFNKENRFNGPLTVLTFKAGVQNGVAFDELFYPVITDKFVFHHTYNYYEKLMFYAGFDIDGKWFRNFDYSADIDYIMLSDSYWAIEHKALTKWETGRKFFNFIIGYQASYGSYPDGDRFFIGPFIDLMWILRRDKLDYGLFGKKMF